MRNTIVTLACSIATAVLFGFLSPAAWGDGIDPIGARGPSAHQPADQPLADPPQSAYSRPTPIDIESHSPKQPAPSSSAQPTKSLRRLQLSRTPTDQSGIGTIASPGSRKKRTSLFSDFTDSSAVTTLAALVFVVGLFFVFAWTIKRGSPKSSRTVPKEAVQILGRVPLSARQFGQLLQVGNKIILVSVNTNGIEKLAEIDNPQEVQRLLGLCASSSRGSSQAEFNEVFGQFAKEAAPQGFLGNEVPVYSGNSAAEAYAQSSGGR